MVVVAAGSVRRRPSAVSLRIRDSAGATCAAPHPPTLDCASRAAEAWGGETGPFCAPQATSQHREVRDRHHADGSVIPSAYWRPCSADCSHTCSVVRNAGSARFEVMHGCVRCNDE